MIMPIFSVKNGMIQNFYCVKKKEEKRNSQTISNKSPPPPLFLNLENICWKFQPLEI